MNIHHYSSTRSRIELYGDHSLECGYCKNGISVTFGGLSSNLLVEDYDMLMQRGWSRSGKKTMQCIVNHVPYSENNLYCVIGLVYGRQLSVYPKSHNMLSSVHLTSAHTSIQAVKIAKKND